MSATVPCHEVVMEHAATAKERKRLLSYLVGTDREFIGEHNPDGSEAQRQLYRERIGRRCRVVSLNPHEEHAPLIVEWAGGARGIAEPVWLAGVAG